MATKAALGYILSLVVADSVFMGGLMVTDTGGLPLEFRYTEPVRATKLQRLLYGDVLEKYIHGDVIAAGLMSRLDQSPDFFIVADPALLEMVDSAGKKAVLLLHGYVTPLKQFGAIQELSENEFFLQLADSGSPVRVRVAGRSAEAASRAEIVRLLTEAGRTLDPAEPLARVEAAVRMLWDETGQTLEHSE